MGVVYNYLKTNHPNLYDYNLIINYLVLNDTSQLPVEVLKNADLFIFQPIKGHGNGDTAFIKRNLLKDRCQCISFPYIYFSGYFPDFTHDPNNTKTVSHPLFPFGVFGYGHQKIMDFIAAGFSPNQIIEKTMQIDLFQENVVKENVKKTLGILAEREKTTDIKLASFIKNNFRHRRLFHSVKHPTNIVLKELLKQILVLMKLPTNGVDTNPFFNTEALTFEVTDIIYPSVAHILGLEFDISMAVCRYERISFVEYVQDYIRCLYPDYYASFTSH